MASRFHSCRSCLSSGISSPSGPVRAGRRASVSSISASNPATSGSSGSRRWIARVSRIASPDSSVRCSAVPMLLVYPSLKIRYSACRTAVSRGVRSRFVGIRNGTPRGLDRLLRAADALRHRAFRHEERIGDLRRCQSADGTQRQRNRRRSGERRMTTHEEQDERVIPLHRPSLAKLRPGIGERRLGDELFAVSAWPFRCAGNPSCGVRPRE